MGDTIYFVLTNNVVKSLLRKVEKLGALARAVGNVSGKKIAVLGWYGDFNVGNDAVLSGILAALKSVMPNSNFTTFSWHPKLTARQNRVKVLPYHELFQSLPRIDVLLVGGGTILTDWQLACPIFFLLVAAIVWAKMVGKKVIFYAVGAEPFSTRIGRFVAQTIFSRADLITVRGNRSKNALEMLELDRPIYVTADPALLLQPEDNGRVDDVLKQKVTGEAKSPRVVVCLRGVSGTRENAKFKRFMAEALDYCVEKFGGEVIFLPISTSVYDDDRKIMAEIIKMMKNHGRVKLITDRLTPQEVMAIIRLSNLVVSMRLHPLIFAATMHTSTIALIGRVNYFVPPSNNKISEFLEMINREAWIYNYEHVKTVELLSKMETLLEARQQGDELTPNIGKLRTMCVHNAKLVKELLQH